MVDLVLVQSNTAVQLAKEVTKLLGFNYSLVGVPFAIDSRPYQMMAKNDDTVTTGREYELLIRYGEVSLLQQLDDRLDHGWRLHGNVFTLGHLPVQAVIKGDIPVIGGNSSEGGVSVDWAPEIEASKKECKAYTDTQVVESGAKIDKRMEKLDEAINIGNESYIMLAQRVAVLEGELTLMRAEFAMEEAERRQDVARLQEQIDAIAGTPKVPDVAVPDPEPEVPTTRSTLPDESVWR
jgi:hypothetical protein